MQFSGFGKRRADELDRRRLRSAANAIRLPEPKPRAMCERFVVPSVRSREIARGQQSRVGHGDDALQPFDFGDGVSASMFLSSHHLSDVF